MSSDDAKPAVVTAPTKVMTWEEFYTKTDNANKLMDRVWYCLGASEAVSDQKVFWEHWYWKDSGEGEKPMDAKKYKEGCNHTLTIAVKDDIEMDYPVWPLTFTKESFKMYPAIDLKCTVIAPIGLPMKPVLFPTEDSRTEFRVDYCEFMGKKLYFIFALDPLMSKEDQDKNFELLEKEHGVQKEWFNMVAWDPEYKVGSAGEPDINPK